LTAFREKPDASPSTSNTEQTTPLLEIFKQVFRNRSFIVLLIVTTLSFSIYTAFFSLLGQLLEPENVDAWVAGWCGVIMMLVGLVGAGIFSTLLGRFRFYALALSFCAGMSIISLGVFYVLLYVITPVSWHLYLGSALMGLFTLSMLPIILEAAAEVTYPGKHRLPFPPGSRADTMQRQRPLFLRSCSSSATSSRQDSSRP
jgi:Na+/melibiose symporter-like transporter